MGDDEKKVFLLRVSKVTSMNGEQIDVTCNVPMSSTDEELKSTLRRMTNLIDGRLTEVNEKLLAETDKSLREYDAEERGHFTEDSKEKKKSEQPNA